jgi:hypothetical protein
MGRRPFFNLFLVTDTGLMPDLNALVFPDQLNPWGILVPAQEILAYY